ncbi:MAG: carbohydrate kinase family protein [Desulfurivibrionaceae bacterium]
MIISIGEVVWDIFSEGKVLGGAPLNVAYHLKALGEEVKLISRVGSDELARETLERIESLGLSVSGIQQDDYYQTGQVRVYIDSNDEPSFDIVKPAAWDFIEDVGPGLSGSTPFYLVFGSLAQRAPQSRRAIRSLWSLADLRFYDVNLRPPHTGRDIVFDSLEAADVVKANEEELQTICSWLTWREREATAQGGRLVNAYNLKALSVSCGRQGSMLITDDGVWEHPGFQVRVSDTVGAGDAFFADLIYGIIHGRSWQDCLKSANLRGAYVAGSNGATPFIPEEIKLENE